MRSFPACGFLLRRGVVCWNGRFTVVVGCVLSVRGRWAAEMDLDVNMRVGVGIGV